jgi:hypothetical protein
MRILYVLFSIFLTIILYSCQRNSKKIELPRNLNLVNLKFDAVILDSLKENIKSFNSSGLILRIHEYDCNTCIDFELENLNKLPANLKNKILLLTAFRNQRALKILLNAHKIGNPVINYLGEFPIPIENIGKPYYFLVDQKGNLSNFHISNIDDKLSILTYFEDVGKYILKTDTMTIIHKTFRLNKSLIDLGKIELNSTHKIEFVLENRYIKPLLIENVIATCGCTAVEWDRDPIKAFGKTIIRVNYNATVKGYFYKKILVLLSEDSGIQVLAIKGEVI